MGEFRRYDGYVMHVPQEFIDSHLPVCPFCRTDHPHWLLDSRMEPSWTGTRTYYRCEQCQATLSSTAADAAQKGPKQQEVNVTYLRVDALGSVCTDHSLLGNEHPVTFYQKMAGTPAVPAAGSAPTSAPVDAEPVLVAAEPKPAESGIRVEESEPRIWRVFALIGMLLGITGMCTMLIPYVNTALIMVPISAIVFSAMGKRSSSYRKANTGMTLGIISTAMSIIMGAVYMAVLE